MEFISSFIRRTSKIGTLSDPVPAPLFRQAFSVCEGLSRASLAICGLGFYEVHLNGEDITKGFLAPYRSNHDHYLYYDEYDITDKVRCGENVLGCILGNGMQNPMGAGVWSFDRAAWRNAPCVSFTLEILYENGDTVTILSDPDTKTADSPILFDDLHYGEYYDARLEQPNWDTIGFDDSGWTAAEWAPVPRGELRRCEAEPIIVRGELQPVTVVSCGDGYLYDFGENNAGLCRLSIEGEYGQKVLLQYAETLVDGKPYFRGIRFNETDRYQEDEYTCKGEGLEVHMPRFTYHGFRYVYVTGIRPEQATKKLLTYVLISSDIRSAGSFVCDHEIVNRIQEATVRSDISNFHYFPTDCPQREKNGWTADASLSAEQMLFNFMPENSYREWLRNIYKALSEDGQLPGIIPTAGWGYHWGNGPGWDNVIVNLPYFTYKYRGDKTILQEVAIPLMRYLTYLYSRLDERDLICFGLGDWCQPNRKEEADYTTPLAVTDSILTVDIARKAACIYDALGMNAQKQYATALAERVRTAIRCHLLNPTTMSVEGDTQTGQCMAIYYNIFDATEKPQAVARLVEQIHQNDDFMDTGVLGGRVLFRVLAESGYADLALRMITRPEHPSYGNWIRRGATTLWELFWKEDGGRIQSMNHHFWGDVSAWFYTYLAGMRINPTDHDVTEVDIVPCFTEAIHYVCAKHILPAGELTVEWSRMGDTVEMTLQIPEHIHGKIRLLDGWAFDNGSNTDPVKTGQYKLKLAPLLSL